MNLWVVFITGLTTGGLSCLAMQGGLLASVIAHQKDKHLNPVSPSDITSQYHWLPIALFLISKLIAHTFIGLLLGMLGSFVTLSLGLRVGFQLFTALYMFATAMNLLNVHPLFRYVVIQPPKSLRRSIRSLSKDDRLFTSILLGIATIFIPCGVTQAMEIIAINSGSPFHGALIMFAFVLGTFPLFSLIGLATSRLNQVLQQKFVIIAAIILILMSLYAVNGAMLVLDSPFSIQKIIWMYRTVKSYESGAVAGSKQQNDGVNVNNIQKATINIVNSGYSPNQFQVKAGQPVELTLVNNGVYSCASAFVFREFGIQAYIKPGTSEKFTFTPKELGKYIFSCSMGMYTGTMEVL